MSDLEFNKIFAAILLAGILAMVAGFVSRIAVSSEELTENAYKIEVAQAAPSSAAAAKASGPEPIAALLAGADIEHGKKVAKKCISCHSFDKGGKHKTGPNLYGVVNAAMAAKDGFKYSDALKEKGGVWDYAALNEWLWKPKSFVPGTKMNFAGLKKPSDRAALVAYMRSMADNPAPLPVVEETAKEAMEEATEEGVEETPAPQDVVPEAGDEGAAHAPAMDATVSGMMEKEASAKEAEGASTIESKAAEHAAPVKALASEVESGVQKGEEQIDSGNMAYPIDPLDSVSPENMKGELSGH